MARETQKACSASGLIELWFAAPNKAAVTTNEERVRLRIGAGNPASLQIEERTRCRLQIREAGSSVRVAQRCRPTVSAECGEAVHPRWTSPRGERRHAYPQGPA